GTSDHVGPKLEIRAKLARIICSGSKVKMCAKLAHIFHGKTDNRNSGQVVRNYRVNTDQLPAKLAGSYGKEVRPGADRFAPLRREGGKEKGKEVRQMIKRHSSSTTVGWRQKLRAGP
ncbi:MAG: hypothetical protein IJI97_09340, partial [Clostridia bacterium]|nr:hypothetical protein [Clostridia bacterium]